MGACTAEGWRGCPPRILCGETLSCRGELLLCVPTDLGVTRPTQHVWEGTSGCRRGPDRHLGLRVPVGLLAVTCRGRLAQVGGAGTLLARVDVGLCPPAVQPPEPGAGRALVVCRLKPASFQENSEMGRGCRDRQGSVCNPVCLVYRCECEGGILSASPPPLCLGHDSRESKA